MLPCGYVFKRNFSTFFSSMPVAFAISWTMSDVMLVIGVRNESNTYSFLIRSSLICVAVNLLSLLNPISPPLPA